jgi:hypothetical protein
MESTIQKTIAQQRRALAELLAPTLATIAE